MRPVAVLVLVVESNLNPFLPLWTPRRWVFDLGLLPFLCRLLFWIPNWEFLCRCVVAFVVKDCRKWIATLLAQKTILVPEMNTDRFLCHFQSRLFGLLSPRPTAKTCLWTARLPLFFPHSLQLLLLRISVAASFVSCFCTPDMCLTSSIAAKMTKQNKETEYWSELCKKMAGEGNKQHTVSDKS